MIGYAEALDPDWIDRRVHLSLICEPESLRSGIGIELAAGFLTFLFDNYPFEKVQMEVQGGNARLVPGLKRLLTHEGTLRRHINVLGRWEDIEVFALWRGEFASILKRGKLDVLLSADVGRQSVDSG